MSGMNLALFSALWLGVLTSVSPCPLAGNIAAVSYIGRHAASFKRVILYGVLYTAGRMLSYSVLAAVAVKGLMSMSGLSFFLQEHLNKLLGPVLIFAGMLSLELIVIPLPPVAVNGRLQSLVARTGAFGALLLGAVLALAFCPVSAAFFFGSLIPLSLAHGSVIVLPTVYGAGTALPVLFFAVLIAFGLKSLGGYYKKLTLIDRYARRLTGIALIVIGIYLALKYIFEFI